MPVVIGSCAVVKKRVGNRELECIIRQSSQQLSTTKQQPLHEALRCDERSVGIGRGSSTILIDLGCKIVRSFPPLRVTCSKDMSVIMMQSERGGA